MKRTFLLSAMTSFSVAAFAQTFVSTTAQNRNVVLEEFTGINCQYCPDGHRIANLIKAANPSRVVLVNVHVGGFSTPSAGQIDLRTNFGTPLSNQSDVTGYPAATVNRHVFSGLGQGSGTAMGRGNWTNAANQALNMSSPVNVAARATIDLATRTLTVVVEAYYTGTSSASTNKLTVALLQNNIEGSQTGASQNPDAILPNGNYNHMHALRHFLTGQWGATISNTSTGSFYTETFTYEIPDAIRSLPVILPDLEVAVFVAEGNQEILAGNMAELTFVSPNAVDALPYEATVSDFICGNELSPTVKIQNLGSQTLTSLDVLYSVNGGPASTYQWTGSLPTASIATIDLPGISFTHLEENTLWVATQNPNGQYDPISSNDIVTVNFLPAKNSGNQVTLNLTTDNYGDETTWVLKGPNGNTIATGGPYGNNVTITENFNLENGCHEFILNDEYGDGICCEYGIGSYSLTSGGQTVYSGGEFAAQEVRLFNVGGVAGVEVMEVLTGFNIYPNPFSDNATLRFDLAADAQVAISVRNVLGQTLIDRQIGHLSAGVHTQQLASDGLAPGIYLVSLLVDGQQHTVRVSVSK